MKPPLYNPTPFTNTNSSHADEKTIVQKGLMIIVFAILFVP